MIVGGDRPTGNKQCFSTLQRSWHSIYRHNNASKVSYNLEISSSWLGRGDQGRLEFLLNGDGDGGLLKLALGAAIFSASSAMAIMAASSSCVVRTGGLAGAGKGLNCSGGWEACDVPACVSDG